MRYIHIRNIRYTHTYMATCDTYIYRTYDTYIHTYIRYTHTYIHTDLRNASIHPSSHDKSSCTRHAINRFHRFIPEIIYGTEYVYIYVYICMYAYTSPSPPSRDRQSGGWRVEISHVISRRLVRKNLLVAFVAHLVLPVVLLAQQMLRIHQIRLVIRSSWYDYFHSGVFCIR